MTSAYLLHTGKEEERQSVFFRLSFVEESSCLLIDTFRLGYTQIQCSHIDSSISFRWRAVKTEIEFISHQGHYGQRRQTVFVFNIIIQNKHDNIRGERSRHSTQPMFSLSLPYLNSDFRRFSGREIAVTVVDNGWQLTSDWEASTEVVGFILKLLCRTMIIRGDVAESTRCK